MTILILWILFLMAITTATLFGTVAVANLLFGLSLAIFLVLFVSGWVVQEISEARDP
jgi:hypothetical protein